MLIKTKNDQTEKAPKTTLSAAVAAAAVSLSVKNVAGFTDDWNAQVGETGEEKTEVKEIVSAPSAGTFGVSALSFEHPADTPVYCVRYNQVIFKQSTTGTAGTATAMTDGTIGITPDWEFTQFDDTGGSTSYAYKTAFRSTGLSSNSSDSDWITPAGHPFYSQAGIRDRVKSKLPSADFVSDDDIDSWSNEWMESMNNTAIDVNEDYRVGTAQVSFSGTIQYGTITSEDFKQVRRAWYTEDGTDWYQMTKQEYTDFAPSADFNETHPYYHMRGDNEIGRNPHVNSGTIEVSYYKLNASLDSDSDLLPVPMRGYTSSFVNYALAQAYRKDNKITDAERLEAKCEFDKQQFKKELTPRNKSEQTLINIVEDWGDNDTFVW